ncbi:MAG TPA: hydroxyphenylacetyl-CoA thioesterase PaaI [Alphaproteobacteria bacterium]|nr:hydroxyphenylacetyl-CoA thioesterase PaaI [Alphaproteobacteria bacterium]
MTSAADRIAAAVGEGMFKRDHAAHTLGIELIDIQPGYARMSMKVRPDMVNGHDICHGGLIFALADTAFAYACNSGNKTTVAQSCVVTFLSAARTGDVLTATATERNRTQRTGLTDIDVTDQSGKLIAVVRGHSHQIKGEVVPGLGSVER